MSSLEFDERLHIAWLYYMDGLTQSEIAKSLGMSRLMVHRILQKCREDGTVKVVINHPQSYCKDLGSQIKEVFRLKNVMVMPTANDVDVLKKNLGTVSARLIGRYITSGTTIGVGWGSTLAQTARFMDRTSANSLRVVSLLGSVTRSAGSNSYEVALEMAKALNATCYNYVAPIIVSTEEERDAILSLAHIKSVQNMIRGSSIAIVGIGEVSSGCSLAEGGVLVAEDIQRLIHAGAVADVVGNFIDINGQVVDIDLNRRMLSIGLDTLAEIENVFAIAGGLWKVQAIFAALRSGSINNLITDAQTAEQVLQMNRVV